MDDLQIGVMGMDANGAVRQQNAHFRMSRRIPVVHIRPENFQTSVGEILCVRHACLILRRRYQHVIFYRRLTGHCIAEKFCLFRQLGSIRKELIFYDIFEIGNRHIGVRILRIVLVNRGCGILNLIQIRIVIECRKQPDAGIGHRQTDHKRYNHIDKRPENFPDFLSVYKHRHKNQQHCGHYQHRQIAGSRQR